MMRKQGLLTFLPEDYHDEEAGPLTFLPEDYFPRNFFPR